MNQSLSPAKILRRAAARYKRARNRFARNQNGMAAIEMAFVFPVMLLVYFGLIDLTDLLSANRRVTLAASTIGDLVTQANGTIPAADLTGFYKSVRPIMEPFPWNTVKIQIYNFRKVGTTPTLQWQHSNGQSCGGAPSAANLLPLMTENNDLIIARVCITVTVMVGKLLGKETFDFKDEIILRPRMGLTLNLT